MSGSTFYSYRNFLEFSGLYNNSNVFYLINFLISSVHTKIYRLQAPSGEAGRAYVRYYILKQIKYSVILFEIELNEMKVIGIPIILVCKIYHKIYIGFIN